MTAPWRRGVLRDAGPAGAPLVVKLGGSLLTRVGWEREVASLLESLPAPRVLVVGGGPLVDGLRAIDRTTPLPTTLAHHLAIACMGHTARVAATALGVPVSDAPGPGDPATTVLDAPAWLAAAGRSDALPAGWHVTSDSIAAVVAAARGGGLMLLKSAPPPDDDLARLAAEGWIDAFFPIASRPLTWIGWGAPAPVSAGATARRDGSSRA